MKDLRAVATLKVVHRDLPQALRGRGASFAAAASDAGGADEDLPGETDRDLVAPATAKDLGPFRVVRPATFEVVKTFSDRSLPTCLTIDVPGGTDVAADLREINDSFPAAFDTGDLVLAFFDVGTAKDGSATLLATRMIKAESDGTAVFPSNPPETIRVTP